MATIAVLGPGGVGGFLAGALARAGVPTTVVAREPTAELIARDGIRIESIRLGSFTAHPSVTVSLDGSVDYLLVATKASGLVAGLERIVETPGLVVPLLNGLDHVATLRRRFGAARVAAGTIRIEADRPMPGVVTQTSPFLRVELAADDRALLPRLETLAAALERAEVPAVVSGNEAQVLWSKLVRLNALACTTSACDCQIGFIRSDSDWREALIGCIYETAAVANADGASIDPAATVAELDDAHPELGSSMQRDIASGREPELDAIPGAVLRAAARHGLECPTIERLLSAITDRTGPKGPMDAARSAAP
jgi:2-dehydropantoate 2-reductase